jgi:hypothetical protein
VTDPVTTAAAISSREELVEYLVNLAERARAGNTPVENETSPDLIEAAAAWTEGIEDFMETRGYDMTRLSPWAIVALIFSAGLVYE